MLQFLFVQISHKEWIWAIFAMLDQLLSNNNVSIDVFYKIEAVCKTEKNWILLRVDTDHTYYWKTQRFIVEQENPYTCDNTHQQW